jgi:succinyl-CoA synthetase beta subunit
METVKLTLSADKALVERAKRFARQHDTSLSAMFREYMESLLARAEGGLDIDNLPPNTRKALGAVRVPDDKSYRELMEEALLEKYGLSE